MDFQPLDPELLAEAMQLAQEIFKDDDQKTIRLCFQEAADPGSQTEFMKEHLCSDIRYWVAQQDGKVIGVTGFYDKTNMPGVIWVSWFCVHPDYRKRGIGTELLQFTIEQAKKEGFKHLKLYTGDDDKENDARRLYERFGFVETHRAKSFLDGQNIIFFQLDLGL